MKLPYYIKLMINIVIKQMSDADANYHTYNVVDDKYIYRVTITREEMGGEK